MSSNFKQQKIKSFHNLYYSDGDHFKLRNLPYWINSYAHWLNKEVNNSLPEYYRSFKQGTIVMIDFGVRLGSEMSSGHFGVVINNNDDKYKRNIIVVPLTSKKKNSYVPLGNEVFSETQKLIIDKIKKWHKKQDALKIEIDTLSNDIKSIEEPPQKVIWEVSKQDITFQKTFNSLNVNSEFEITNNIITELEKHPNLSELPHLLKYLAVIKSIMIRLSDTAHHMEKLVSEVESLEKLFEELKKYNKETYADINNITTVSKLRVQKFSSYAISSNITLSANSIDKLRKRFYKIF
ncbi:type II toxin-antitoxin system PemK/MazF family toxin [Leuconostoc suionicum]|uniref:type II toxin-antitoxin system PemK/MazF family toxin n=1 Tax=Leuconostoc suionicum TaxID=1511761 RepID=UPI0024AC8BC5|nr:type II toxin-antitoxin system PemK/MazF family toxin [Leuconostoc suionicum]MDI6551116.1 type II toxin-antitoxin system PemK/MazF family toxin [Leuconostoc suionicum]